MTAGAQIRGLLPPELDALSGRRELLSLRPWTPAGRQAARDKKTLSARRKYGRTMLGAISMRLLRAVLASAHGRSRGMDAVRLRARFHAGRIRRGEGGSSAGFVSARQGDEDAPSSPILEAKAKARRWTDAYAGVGRVLEQNRIRIARPVEVSDSSAISIGLAFIMQRRLMQRTRIHRSPSTATTSRVSPSSAIRSPASLRKPFPLRDSSHARFGHARSDMAVRLQSLERSAEAMQSASTDSSGGHRAGDHGRAVRHGHQVQDYELATRSAVAAPLTRLAFTLADGNRTCL